MAYTFGTGTTNALTITPTTSFANDNSVQLVAGWFYPTTLTASKGYWAFGTTGTNRSIIDPTNTDEIRINMFNATTAGQWVTTGADIVVNEWQFIAWLGACENTTVPGDWRVWVGHGTNPPVEVTVTNAVVREGVYTASGNIVIGNINGKTAAFQGDIGAVSFLHSGAASINNFAGNAASGVITNDEAENVYRRVVLPLWDGTFSTAQLPRGANADTWEHILFPCDGTQAVRVLRSDSSASSSSLDITNSGVTFSENREPIVAYGPWWPMSYRKRAG